MATVKELNDKARLVGISQISYHSAWAKSVRLAPEWCDQIQCSWNKS
jgi:hypothetical protein